MKICDKCGKEKETKIHYGKRLCIDCFKKYLFQLKLIEDKFEKDFWKTTYKTGCEKPLKKENGK